jgi:rhomboid family GlyGly-CTERM serine protease
VVPAHWLKQMPWCSISLAIGCISVMLIPSLAEWFIYDRTAIVRGELWRILTAHTVHYSASHLVNNMLILMPAAILTEARSRKDLMLVLGFSAVAIGLAVMSFEPGISRYAGVSGVALALLTYIALGGMSVKGRWRTVCMLILAVIVVKLAAESLFGWHWIDWQREAGFVPVTIAHLTGAASGFLVWCVRFVSGKRSSMVAAGMIPDNQP